MNKTKTGTTMHNTIRSLYDEHEMIVEATEVAKDAAALIGTDDARSERKYGELHVKGAINLSFPDIAVASLARTIPDKGTRILIYCNNNFANAEGPFPSKLPSASLNAPGSARRQALYEPIHGSAPDIAGQGLANPLGSILSFALCLHHGLERVLRGVDDISASRRSAARLPRLGLHLMLERFQINGSRQ